ncbi:MAG TPA: hypothetical protein VFV85_08090 [Conexibacter sp.]|nr:hypothetical protein [Conexibacter sp.]
MSKGDRTLGVRARTQAAPAARSDVAPAQLAWLLALPGALLLLAAIVLLGPPLGRLLFPPPGIAFWNTGLAALAIRPEPTEQARYLIAVAGPIALAALLLALRRRPLPLSDGAAALAAHVSQVLLAAFTLAALVAQYRVVYDHRYSGGHAFRRVYFTPATLVAAALLTAGGVALLHRQALVARVRGWVRETDGRALAGWALAVLFVVLWLLTAVNTEGSLAHANAGVQGNVTFWLDEAYAVLDGRYPLVDFHAQYSQLWPYVAAGFMRLAGPSFGAYVALMVTASGLCLLAVYAALRRVVRSSLLALALFAPFVATGFFMQLGPPSNRYGPSNLFSMFPMRYGGPYVLAWLLVRHVDGDRPRRGAWLFLAAGIVALNNPEFGLGAFGATFAALLWSDVRPWRARLLALVRDALLGLLGALALVALLTLVVAGSLPHLSYLFTFSRLWGLGGVTMLPMPALGFHLAIYLTFAAAIVVATVRALQGAEQRSLTALLAWAGVFGLGAGTYFAGRSHPEVLIGLFSAWALALALLLVVVVRAVLARADRRPHVAELALLAGCALAACSLAQTPLPWSQISRIGRGEPVPAMQGIETRRFVQAAHVARGERVLIIAPLGHRVAHDLGLVNVSPYVSMTSMPAKEQLGEALRALRASGGRRVFLYLDEALSGQIREIQDAGYRLALHSQLYAEFVAQ